MRILPDIEFDDTPYREFTQRTVENRWDSWAMFRLALQVHRSRLSQEFDGLTCVEHLPAIIPYPHQLHTAERVIRDFQGRAILADEVGLG
ncbi:MAG: ATP-dependent helicase, partial [Alicyclobacillaceae bacterium]|nr:ATP-dependent helicase [Alicyclobacillaceae bacterium]